MRWRIDRKTRNQGIDNLSKYTPLRHNVKALLALFVITVCTGAITWRGYVTAFINNPTPQWFGYDFIFIYTYARVFLNGGDIFHILLPGVSASFPVISYAYPLPSIYLFAPLAYLSFQQARIVWAAISVAALIFSGLLIIKTLHHYEIRLSKFEILLIFIALFLFEATTVNLIAVNVNILIFFLVTSFYYLFFVQKRTTGAGIVLGVVAIIKIWPLVFVFLDFLHKSKRMLIATIATIVTMCLGTLWLQGISAWLGWFAAFRNLDYVVTYGLVDYKDIMLAWPMAADNVNFTAAILQVIILFDLNLSKAAITVDISKALVILTIAKIVFVCGVFLFLFKTSKSKQDLTKSKEWDILSFTLLMLSVLLVSNWLLLYYATWLALSFILIIFVIPLSFIEKTILMISIGLFSTYTVVGYLSWHLGGFVRIIAYIIPPQLVAYVLFVTLITYVIRDRTKSGYWLPPP